MYDDQHRLTKSFYTQCMGSPYVLIVEDDHDLRRMIESLLTKVGYVVESTPHADFAFQRCRDNPPTVIITDLMMPGVDGASLLRRLQRWFGDDLAPVIIISASQARGQLGKEFGARVLPKPFRMADLLQIVQEAFQESLGESVDAAQHTQSEN